MFRSIVGHRRLVSLLSRAVARGTLPPTLLMAGPAGVGKRRTALAIAKSLNCLSPVAGTLSDAARDGDAIERDACGTCAACRRIDRGVHPDIIVISPDNMGTIKIEVVRDAIDRTGFRPFEARRRVVIIDEADAMQAPAQSALLKTLEETLEEPPPSSIFLLVSSLPDALLATVQSRCPRLRFGVLSPAEIAAVLVRDHEYSEPDARAAASDAGGSVGSALGAQSSTVAEARAAAQRLLERTAGTADPARRLDAARELTGSKSGSTTPEERDRLAVCFRTAASLLRDLGLLAEGADARLLANTDLRAQLDALSRSYDRDRCAQAYAAVDQALVALERNASPKIVADWLVLQI
jgi:DNA polymerase-3 subunit delta'